MSLTDHRLKPPEKSNSFAFIVSSVVGFLSVFLIGILTVGGAENSSDTPSVYATSGRETTAEPGMERGDQEAERDSVGTSRQSQPESIDVPTNAEPGTSGASSLPPEYVTEGPETLQDYVPYVGGAMGWGGRTDQIIDSVCGPSTYSDANGTELPYSCVSSNSDEILHFGVFDSMDESEVAIFGYLEKKPMVHYIYESVEAGYLVIAGSEDGLGPLVELFGLHIYFPREYNW